MSVYDPTTAKDSKVIRLLKGGDSEAPIDTLRDVPAQLRKLADSIAEDLAAAEGKFPEGVVCRCSIVLRVSGREPLIYSFGTVEHMAQTYMDLHAGAQELMAMRHPERST